MLSCRPLHFYIRTGLGTFLANNKVKMTTFRLTGITKSVKFINYHVAYTFADGRIRYIEMRREKNSESRIYLQINVNDKNLNEFAISCRM